MSIVEQIFREDTTQDIVDSVYEFGGLSYRDASAFVRNIVEKIHEIVEDTITSRVAEEATELARELIEEKIGEAARSILTALGE